MNRTTTVPRSPAAVLLSLLLVLGACSSSDAPAESSGDSAQPARPTQPAPPTEPLPATPETPTAVVAPEVRRTFDGETMVQCGNPPLFAAAALTNPTLLADTTLVDETAFAPIAEFLASAEGVRWPQSGFWVLANDPQSLLLAHVGPNEAITLLGTELDDDGWKPSALQSGRSCPIQVPLPTGVHEVDWRIDPDAPADAASTSVSLLATGRACSSGQPMGERLQPPQVMTTESTVYVVLVATTLSGAQQCPGNPEESVTVELGEPLGTRTIVDARTAAGVLTDYLPLSP